MHAFIVGYGYVGYYLAQELLKQNYKVTAWSRETPLLIPKNKAMTHQRANCMDHNIKFPTEVDIVFYCAPPPDLEQDSILQAFLNRPELRNIENIVYLSSSSVYGNYQGHWVTEDSALCSSSPLGKRRIHAEHQLTNFCLKHKINISILRTAGIYGENRLPLEKVKSQAPLIRRNEAPMVNLIYVNDLVEIAISLSQKVTGQMIFNVSDGMPKPWGETQRIMAEILCVKPAIEISLDDYYQKAGPRLQEFLKNNKKLSVEKVSIFLEDNFHPTPLREAIYKLLALKK